MGIKKTDDLILGALLGICFFYPSFAQTVSDVIVPIIPADWVDKLGTYTLAFYGAIIGALAGYWVGRT